MPNRIHRVTAPVLMPAPTACRSSRPASARCRHQLYRLVLNLALLAPCSPAVLAKPVEMVVPLAAGGVFDTVARIVSDDLARRINEPVVVVNKSGAGTMIGTRFVAEQGTPDGRTLLFGASAMATTEFVQRGKPFNMAELSPIIYVGWQVPVLYVRSTLPASSVAELVQWARRNPNGIAFGSAGNVSSPHIAAELFSADTGIKLTHVPFSGSAGFLPAIAGGHIDAVFSSTSTRTMVKSGQLKALMVASDKPFPDWLELPTAQAAGLPGFRAGSWYGVFVPARTPADAQKKLNADINAVLALAHVREKFVAQGVEIGGGSQDVFSQTIKADLERLRQLVKTRNIAFE